MTVCALCREPSDLRRSHLLPKALYKLLRTEGDKNPNPVALSETKFHQTSYQVRQPLLCNDCEEIFSREGERATIGSCFRSDDSFPLREELLTLEPLARAAGGALYCGRYLKTASSAQLVYFAASVFWRASVSSWTAPGGPDLRIRLGTKYQEAFRRYLLGRAEFPKQAAMWISVSNGEFDGVVLSAPVGVRHVLCHVHQMIIPGLWFRLLVGNRIRPENYQSCAYHSPLKVLHLGSIIDEVALEQTRALAERHREIRDGRRGAT